MSKPQANPFLPMLDKMKSEDKDFRYMATSDLQAALASAPRSPLTPDDNDSPGGAGAVVAAVLQRLGDASSDVSALAVKCLGPLVGRLSDARARHLLSSLAGLLVSPEGAARDVGAVALRTVIAEATAAPAAAVADALVPALVAVVAAGVGLAPLPSTGPGGAAPASSKKRGGAAAAAAAASSSSSTAAGVTPTLDATTAALDALSDAIAAAPQASAAAGNDRKRCSPTLLESLLAALDDERPGPRKRAAGCLASLAPALDAAALCRAADDLVARACDDGASSSAAAASSSPRSAAQSASALAARRAAALAALAGLARTAGARAAPSLERGVRPLLSALSAPAPPPGTGAEEEADADERKELVLSVLSAVAARAPRAARPHLAELFDATLSALDYDPNFVGGSGGGDGGDENGGGLDDDDGGFDDDGFEDDGFDDDDDLEDDDGGGFSDDGDTSWRVRRAAARALASILGAGTSATLSDFYPRAAPALVRRLPRERDAGVLSDVFAAYSDLARRAGGSSAQLRERLASDVASAAAPALAKMLGGEGGAASKPRPHRRGDSLAGTDTAKAGVVRVVAALAEVVPGALAESAAVLLPGLLAVACGGGAGNGATAGEAESAPALRAAALAALRSALAGAASTAAASPWARHALPPSTVAPALAAAAAGERYYRAAAAALRCCGEVARVVRPVVPVADGSAAPPPPALPAGADAVASDLAGGVLPRLRASDADAEVKEAAVAAAASLASCLGDALSASGELRPLLEALLGERLKDQGTLAAAARALASAARSPLCAVGGGGVAGDVAGVVASTAAAPELVAALRQAARPPRAAALDALVALASRGMLPADDGGAALAEAVSGASALVSDGDLGLAASALSLGAAASSPSSPAALDAAAKAMAPRALALASSPLLQGPALAALSDFFVALARSQRQPGAKRAKKAEGGASEIVAALLNAGRSAAASAASPSASSSASASASGTSSSRGVLHNVARVVAAVLCRSSSDAAEATAVTKSLLAEARGGPKVPEGAQVLATLCVGEVGRLGGLAADASLVDEAREVLSSSMASDAATSDELARAAALSLGAAAAGGVVSAAAGGGGAGAGGELRSWIADRVSAATEAAVKELASIDYKAGDLKSAEAQRGAYLLLRSLNEAIVDVAAAGEESARSLLPEGAVSRLLEVLLAAAEAGADDEARAVAAEGAGHLARADPERVLSALVASASSPRAGARLAAAAAVRHAVAGAPPRLVAALSSGRDGGDGSAVAATLSLLGDDDRHVRKAAVQALSATARHAPRLLSSSTSRLFASSLPLLYKQTVPDESLVRVVDLGPFKHKIDDGLELRKAAVECMDVLLDASSASSASSGLSGGIASLDVPAFAERLVKGLEDHADVKLPCLLLLPKLAKAAAASASADGGGGGAVGAAVARAAAAAAAALEATATAKPREGQPKQEADRSDDLARAAVRAADALSRVPGVLSPSSDAAPEAGGAGAFAAFWERLNGPQLSGKLAAVRAGDGSEKMDTS